ncbi:MAG TPA: hypothetical protein VMW01_07060 [Williamwhitmania sp.]|nr:hypothetical protein [Williamwhitmania sp.]
MRIIHLLIFLPLLTSCQQSRVSSTNNSSSIERFENVLGKQETDYLNEIVQDFEGFLNSSYSGNDLASKYKAYLTDISNNTLKHHWKIDSLKMLRYEKSNLFAKYDTVYADTVWFEDGMVNFKFKNDNLVQSIIPIEQKNRALNIDSLIQDTKSKPYIKLISESQFYVALDSIAHGDSLILDIIDSKSNPNQVEESLFARGLLKHNPDFSNYFIKRIIALETAENLRYKLH